MPGVWIEWNLQGVVERENLILHPLFCEIAIFCFLWVCQIEKCLSFCLVILNKVKDLENILYAIEILPPYGRLNDKKKGFLHYDTLPFLLFFQGICYDFCHTACTVSIGMYTIEKHFVAVVGK